MADIAFQRFASSFTENIEPPVRHHLKNVYGTVTIATLCASLGGYVHLFSSYGASPLTLLLAIGSLLGLTFTPHNGKNQATRLSLLSVFAFFSGTNLGPLLEVAIRVNPAIVMEALLGTAIVFACFSVAALVAPRGQYLYLGGTLLSVASTLLFLAIFNIFVQSRLLFEMHLYLSLLMVCGFVVFDTQMIMEKRRMGNTDYISHGLELFLDFLIIFKKLVVILTDKEANKRNNKKRN